MVQCTPRKLTFRDYLRVVKGLPRFPWSVALTLITFAGLAVKEPLTTVAIAIAIGASIFLLSFPVWRRLAALDPVTATEGHPDLLNEIPEDRPFTPASQRAT